MKRAPCTVYRPDATGNMVPVGVQRQAPTGVRAGRYVLWCELTQSELCSGTLAQCVRAAAESPDSAQCCYFERGYPQPLNRAERAELRRLMEEESE